MRQLLPIDGQLRLLTACDDLLVSMSLPLLTTSHKSPPTGFPVLAHRSIQAAISQHQPLDWFPSDNVRVNDFVDVGLSDVSVPNGFGIDDDSWTVLALIETAGLVGSHCAFEAAFREFLFEQFL